MADVYSIVTEKILAALEAGVVPWHKPWDGQASLARNAISNKPYTGINAFLLNLSAYSDPRWVTFKQAQSLGGSVRKGEKSSLVVFWKQYQNEDEDGNATKKGAILRYYLVFNVEQCENLSKLKPLEEKAEVDAIAEAEAIVAGMPSPPKIDDKGKDQAFYRPSADAISMPKKSAFGSSEEYYSTLFHELSHSTGHPNRLNRAELNTLAPFGSETYSKEELVAEFGAAFLCGEAGIQTTVENSAAYIKGWLNALKNDKRLAVSAASQGQKAANHILGRS
jgi:antirestriction protein ArdC